MYNKRKVELEIKWMNTCGMCCIHCISYGTGECHECCDVNDISCKDCKLESTMYNK